MPTASGSSTDHRIGTVIDAVGRPNPAESNRMFRSFANPMPARIPIADAIRPTISASLSTARSTWRRLAPMVRSIANSRVR